MKERGRSEDRGNASRTVYPYPCIPKKNFDMLLFSLFPSIWHYNGKLNWLIWDSMDEFKQVLRQGRSILWVQMLAAWERNTHNRESHFINVIRSLWGIVYQILGHDTKKKLSGLATDPIVFVGGWFCVTIYLYNFMFHSVTCKTNCFTIRRLDHCFLFDYFLLL